MESSEQQNAEGLRIELRHLAGGERHERDRREWARLGPQQRFLLRGEGWHQRIVQEMLLEACSSDLLPTETTLGAVFVFHVASSKSQVSVNSSQEGGW